MRTFTVFLFLIIASFVSVPAQTTDADREAIRRTVLNYAEGWYEGNADRMDSSLHQHLAKRVIRVTEQGESRLDQLSALGLVRNVRAGVGKSTPVAEQRKDVVILDATGNVASVKLVMRDWIDYIHLGKFNGKWLIINVLWETKPKKQ